GVTGFLRDVLERWLIDVGRVLRGHDLVAAQVLEHRQRVEQPRMPRRVGDDPAEHGARLEHEVVVVGGEARERAIQPRSRALLVVSAEHNGENSSEFWLPLVYTMRRCGRFPSVAPAR